MLDEIKTLAASDKDRALPPALLLAAPVVVPVLAAQVLSGDLLGTLSVIVAFVAGVVMGLLIAKQMDE